MKFFDKLRERLFAPLTEDEERMGEFADADGYELLDYLVKHEFDAVRWVVEPGSWLERGVLEDLDTTMPEYQAFMRRVYANTLERLGFGDLLQDMPEAQQAQQTVQTEMDIEEMELGM